MWSTWWTWPEPAAVAAEPASRRASPVERPPAAGQHLAGVGRTRSRRARPARGAGSRARLLTPRVGSQLSTFEPGLGAVDRGRRSGRAAGRTSRRPGRPPPAWSARPAAAACGAARRAAASTPRAVSPRSSSGAGGCQDGSRSRSTRSRPRPSSDWRSSRATSSRITHGRPPRRRPCRDSRRPNTPGAAAAAAVATRSGRPPCRSASRCGGPRQARRGSAGAAARARGCASR